MPGVRHYVPETAADLQLCRRHLVIVCKYYIPITAI